MNPTRAVFSKYRKPYNVNPNQTKHKSIAISIYLVVLVTSIRTLKCVFLPLKIEKREWIQDTGVIIPHNCFGIKSP
ncbi:hypothetical protein BH18THE2_BH18THE2_39750 [soil metagenome]